MNNTSSAAMPHNIERHNINCPSGRAVLMRVTPEMAEKWLAMNYSRNRDVNKNVVAFYADQMRRGRWRYNGDTVKFDTDGNLQDGQHRLRACVMAGVPFDTLVVRGISVDAYITQNTGKAQSASDVFKMNDVQNYVGIASIVRSYMHIKSGYTATYMKVLKYSNEDIFDAYMADKDLFDLIASKCGTFKSRTKTFVPSECGAGMAYLVRDKHYPIELVFGFYDMVTNYKDFTNGICVAVRDFLRHNAESEKKYDRMKIRKMWAYGFSLYIKGSRLKTLKGLNSTSITSYTDIEEYAKKGQKGLF